MKVFWCALFTVMCLFSSVPSFGLGMEVDPVEIVLENCPLGEKVLVSNLGGSEMTLRIQNKAPVDYTYTIGVLSSSDGNSPLKHGYMDIPEVSWIIPESKEVRVPANSTGETELYINVPDREEYGGKKYQAVIEVKSKKNNAKDIFVLAVQIGMRVSTQPSKSDLDTTVTSGGLK